MFGSKLTKINVDFNALPAEEPTIRVLRSQAQKALNLQERVLLYDTTHRQAEGTIQQLDGNTAVILIDWDTWSVSNDRELGDKIGLFIAFLCILMIALAVSALLHSLWIGILIAVVALVIVLMHQ